MTAMDYPDDPRAKDEIREDDDLRMMLEARLHAAEERREQHAIECERFDRISRVCRAGLAEFGDGDPEQEQLAKIRAEVRSQEF